MIKKLLENILEAIDSLLVVIDKNHRIVLSNWKDHEWVPEEERLKKPYCYNVFKNFESPCETCPAVKTFKDGRSRFFKDQNPIDGRYKEISVVPLLNHKNEVEYVLENIRDVTEQRRSEENQKRLQAQLIQASKMESVGRLAGGVAHDFNNMLSVILGRTELIMSQLEPGNPIYRDLEEILKSGHRSAELIRQLLAFARKQAINPRILDINKTISGMLKMLRRIIGENIELIWKPRSEIWPIKIDPVQIDQILANLCINSRDAILKGGKITIETDNVILDERYCEMNLGASPGRFAMLEISDDGHGMDQETLKHIFEPFFTTKEPGKGTGLGLATVYGIVKQNSGFIKVTSRADEGSSFKLFFPKVDRDIVTETHPFSKPITAGTETILVVEDEDAILSFLKTFLGKLGYKVFAAKTPGQAIEIFRQPDTTIHLVISDVVMPEMNGKELCAHIKAIHPDSKILFMSGYTSNVITHHGVLEKEVNFLQKPFSNKELAEKIREILDMPQNLADPSKEPKT